MAATTSLTVTYRNSLIVAALEAVVNLGGGLFALVARTASTLSMKYNPPVHTKHGQSLFYIKTMTHYFSGKMIFRETSFWESDFPGNVRKPGRGSGLQLRTPGVCVYLREKLPGHPLNFSKACEKCPEYVPNLGAWFTHLPGHPAPNLNRTILVGGTSLIS